MRVFAERNSLPAEKKEEYLRTISRAFDMMDDWRQARTNYVKARRTEIDTAISFLRNKAIEKANCRLKFAPAARNAASALRTTLSVSARDYDDSQLPEVVACNIYDVAAVRTLFPFDFGNLTCFHPGHDVPAGTDSFVLMLKRAGQETGIERSVESLMQEVARIWREFNTPAPLHFPDGYWTAQGDGADAKLHYAAIAAFHRVD